MTPGASARPSHVQRTLILGGVRSGKSRLAEALAAASGLPVTYVATALAGDGEMAQRIDEHRSRRRADWRTLEEPLALAEVMAREAGEGRCLLVECLTLWLINLLMQPDGDDGAVAAAGDGLCAAVAAAPGRIILVGNETNMGVVPLGEISRRFCDQAGRLHQGLAACCDQVVLTVAGLPLALKGPAP